MFRKVIKMMPAAAVMMIFGVSAGAQVRPVVHFTPALAAAPESKVMLTALNVCEVPVLVKMTLMDGATGEPVGRPFEAIVDPQRTAQVDEDVPAAGARSAEAGGPRSEVPGATMGTTFPRVFARVEVAPGPGGPGAMINCVALHGAPVIGQLEILNPTGNTTAGLLLPAVQKVREAASK